MPGEPGGPGASGSFCESGLDDAGIDGIDGDRDSERPQDTASRDAAICAHDGVDGVAERKGAIDQRPAAERVHLEASARARRVADGHFAHTVADGQWPAVDSDRPRTSWVWMAHTRAEPQHRGDHEKKRAHRLECDVAARARPGSGPDRVRTASFERRMMPPHG